MQFNLLFEQTLAVQIHVACVSVAIAGVITVLILRKGTKLHKALGRIWVTAMALTALSSFWINEIDHFFGFSAIHLISIYVLTGLVRGIVYARKGNISAHKKTMYSITFGGLVIAGGFTFLPGRLMNEIFLVSLF